jgi:hypothetical protein
VLGVKTDHRLNAWVGKPLVAGTAGAISDSSVGLGAPIGGRRNEGHVAVRLGLLRVGRPRRCRLRSGRPVDPGAPDPTQPERWRAGILHDVVLGRHADRDPGGGRGAALGDRGRLRDGQDRTRARSQRDPLLARLAPARQLGDDGLRPAGSDLPSRQRSAPKKPGSDETAR